MLDWLCCRLTLMLTVSSATHRGCCCWLRLHQTVTHFRFLLSIIIIIIIIVKFVKRHTRSYRGAKATEAHLTSNTYENFIKLIAPTNDRSFYNTW